MPSLTVQQALDLAKAHHQAGRVSDAADLYAKILEVERGSIPAIWGLAEIMRLTEQFEREEAIYRQAITLYPDSAPLRVRLGFALNELGRADDAHDAFKSAVEVQPDFAEAHYGWAWTLLARGDFANGWRENEWRFKCATLPGKERKFDKPSWDGSDLHGKTILLYQEQGLGDVIQYIRYVPMVAAKGGRVIVGCADAIERLARTVPGVAEVAPNPDRLPAFDTHLSLHSLPFALWPTLQSIPADVPYLRVDESAAKRWRDRIVRDDKTLRVGLVWQGNPKHQNDARRSIAAPLLRALAGIENVEFFSFQKHLSIEAARQIPAELKMQDFTSDLRDLADTAAAMTALDLVISVDTSIAHLAGAIGRPVWTLLPLYCDWRWMLGRSDSPWYPTMRLFRQSKRLDWPGVLQSVAAELKIKASEKR